MDGVGQASSFGSYGTVSDAEPYGEATDGEATNSVL